MQRQFIYSQATITLVYSAVLFVVGFTLYYLYSKIDAALPTPVEEYLLPKLDDARLFIIHGYPEIRTLGLQFLTLLSAILVFSTTFSEKIIDYKVSGILIKMVLITAWCLIICAIILDGVSLAYNAFALPNALTDNQNISEGPPTFYDPAFRAIKTMLFAGVCFIYGIIFIMIASILSMFNKK